jgi:hypothetical protein
MLADRAKHRMLAVIGERRGGIGYHRLPPLRVPVKFIEEFTEVGPAAPALTFRATSAKVSGRFMDGPFSPTAVFGPKILIHLKAPRSINTREIRAIRRRILLARTLGPAIEQHVRAEHVRLGVFRQDFQQVFRQFLSLRISSVDQLPIHSLPFFVFLLKAIVGGR